MNKYINPPCNISLATSFIIFKKMSTREEEVGITSLFGGSVANDERELAIDEGVSASSAVPSSQFVPDLNVMVMEEEECVGGALEEVEASDGRAEEASERDSFMDHMGGLEKEAAGEIGGLQLRTFCNVQIYCWRLC